jgi:hypothetical protein
MRSRVLDHLKLRDKQYGIRTVDEDDLKFELLCVSRRLCSNYYFDINTELTTEAERWVISNGECLIDRDFDRPFSWFSKRTMLTHYHLPHLSKNVVPLEVLAHDFKHEPGWLCSICLAIDVVDPTCIRTTCKHIFHVECLSNCKRVFLEQKENCTKTCLPCPLCRAPIYFIRDN